MSNVKEFNVIICGSKDFQDYKLFCDKCDAFLSSRIERGDKIVVYTGSLSGAEAFGIKYAKEKGFDAKVVSPNWDKYGNKAGYFRNNNLAKLGNSCLAFITNTTDSGVKMMVDIAKRNNLLVREYKELEETA